MKLHKILSLSMATCMSLILLAGCNGTGAPPTSQPTGGNVQDVETAIKSEPAPKFICAGLDGKNNETHPFMIAAQKFKEQYKKEVQFISTGDQLWNDKFSAAIAAGDPIDGCFITIEQYLNFMIRDYIQPLENYVDLSKADSASINKFAMKDGKTYIAPQKPCPYVIYYNKDILTNNGYDEDEPKKLYEAGNWNWDTFYELAAKCNDPDQFIVGFENMFVDVFMTSNNASVLKRDESGLFSLTLKDPAVKQSLEFIQKVHYKNKVAGGGYTSGRSNFIAGNAAMCGAYSYDEPIFANAINDGMMVFEYGVAPFPYGPSNTEKINPAYSQGFAIATGSKAPYSMGKFIDLMLTESIASDEENNANLGVKENQDFIAMLGNNINHVNYEEGIMTNGFGSFWLLDNVLNGADINKKVDEYEPEFKKQIEEINEFLK